LCFSAHLSYLDLNIDIIAELKQMAAGIKQFILHYLDIRLHGVELPSLLVHFDFRVVCLMSENENSFQQQVCLALSVATLLFSTKIKLFSCEWSCVEAAFLFFCEAFCNAFPHFRCLPIISTSGRHVRCCQLIHLRQVLAKCKDFEPMTWPSFCTKSASLD